MENALSSRPVYERIIFNRGEQSVRGYTYETHSDKAFVENYVYKMGDGTDAEKTMYDIFLYKNPGLKKMLRFKLHNWGVQTMESINKKEQELEMKLRESKDALKEAKDKLVLETKDKFKEKISEIKSKINNNVSLINEKKH